MQLGSLHIYPVKSGRGVDLDHADLQREGLAGDRRWMVVDRAKQRFLTQRELPSLALLHAELQEDGVILTFGDVGERFVPHPSGEARAEVTIWRDQVDVALADEPTHEALSRWLGRSVQLVYQDQLERAASAEWAGEAAPVSLADGYPILVTTSASLRDLNSRLVYDGHEPVTMSRFRPNLVIDGADAWAEDGWATIRVGSLLLDLVKPCARCAITTVDPQEGRFAGDQPLTILRETRMSADRRVPGVLFGWNAVPRSEGRLDVGDQVEVIARRDTDVVR